ncbi:rRNA maturation RNase YbeY [Flexithrix dorotheae]|uniref:rRNA maturation RNase YbeY n=1 Tax=Flexithrix dorotheae TaxID=70993 RepID=UPI0004783A5D|nr:rRNA maturation RNase YbeY [Flexithrix dorotheae]
MFFCEDVDFELENSKNISKWIASCPLSAGFQIEEINYIFCSDEYLYKLNMEFLHHDTYTDIITFDNSESDKKITADIFISIERVKENSKKFNVSFSHELNRVLIHGVLHLIGFKDKSPSEEKEMKNQEDLWLSKFTF